MSSKVYRVLWGWAKYGHANGSGRQRRRDRAAKAVAASILHPMREEANKRARASSLELGAAAMNLRRRRCSFGARRSGERQALFSSQLEEGAGGRQPMSAP